MPRLLVAASGTGGHLFPALAVVDALPKSWTVKWLGVSDRLEMSLLPDHIELLTVKAGAVQAHGFRRLLQIAQLLLASGRVIHILRKEKIQFVLTTGGYIAAPAILAAKCLGLPVLLHESNAVPGRVSRLLGRFCKVVAIGLPVTAQYLRGCRPVLTGTPVRAAFHLPQTLPSWVPSGSGPLLVVIGGSQGAIGLNQMVRAALPSLLEAGCRVVHLTGQNDPDFRKWNHPNLFEKGFSEDVPALLQNADLAISRAGAGSLSELAICSTPSILVPYPNAKDKHQDANANCFAELGAAVIIHQHSPEHWPLKDALWRLLNYRLKGPGNYPDPLIAMKNGIEKLATYDADKKLVELIVQFNLGAS